MMSAGSSRATGTWLFKNRQTGSETFEMAPRPSRTAITHLQRLAAAAVVACTLVAVTGCGLFDSRDSPDELIGTWRTDSEGYERSYLEIERDRLVIGMGQFELYDVAIDRVSRTQRSAHEIEYVLHYTAVEGYSDSFRLDYRPGEVPTLRMQRPAGLWKRVP